jgi:hypothetical protein
MNCDTIKGCVFEDSAFNMMARLISVGGAYVTTSSVSTITWKAFNITDDATVVASGSLVVNEVIFNTLQIDGRWAGKDSLGYNFLHVLPAGTLTSPGTYRIEHKVVMADADSTEFYLHPFQPKVESIWSS